MKVDLSRQNDAFITLIRNPETVLVVDANFFIPPDRTRIGAQEPYSFQKFREVWVEPVRSVFVNIAVHEAVVDELVAPDVQAYVQPLLASHVIPRLILLRDTDLDASEKIVRATKEQLIAPFTNYDPHRDNRQDRGEVKTLAYMAIRAEYLYFVTNDQKAIRLIDQAAELGTSLDELRSVKFFEGIYLLQRHEMIPRPEARKLYRYLYYLTPRERSTNPPWDCFLAQMDELYGGLFAS